VYVNRYIGLNKVNKLILSLFIILTFNSRLSLSL
ncbi:hypothetical protein FPSE_11258, partial [Fusarium pseudograminearum CS3096]